MCGELRRWGVFHDPSTTRFISNHCCTSPQTLHPAVLAQLHTNSIFRKYPPRVWFRKSPQSSTFLLNLLFGYNQQHLIKSSLKKTRLSIIQNEQNICAIIQETNRPPYLSSTFVPLTHIYSKPRPPVNKSTLLQTPVSKSFFVENFLVSGESLQ